MIAIVDCNNFYASCERLFRPELNGLPIVVLSNNDGCVIARSNESKALGIKMGDPAFLIQQVLEQHNIRVFSSNYTLYGDISRRVVYVLSQFASDVEVYSIDEAFLDLKGYSYYDLDAYGAEIRAKVKKHTGIPVGIGIAPSKSLAKAANKYAKKMFPAKGVYVMDTEAKREEVLRWLPVEDIWGIGFKNRYFFQDVHGIRTAWEFSKLDEGFVRKKMGVVGVRLLHELNGISCMPLEMVLPPKQNICTSRSFPNDIYKLDDLKAAVATHATRCAEKLREQESCAGVVQVFITTNPHNGSPQHARNIPLTLFRASDDTRELIKWALYGLHHIYRPGYGYKKCGVIVSKIVPSAEVQASLFDNVVDRKKDERMIRAMDAINKKMGQDKVHFGVTDLSKDWKMKREYLSPCYTTNWNEILTIKL